MQRHGGEPDTGIPDRVHQPVGKMKSSGRRRHGTPASGIDGLVILVVGSGRAGIPGDIGRQRHFAVSFQRVEQLFAARKRQQDLATFSFFVHARCKTVREINHITGGQLSRWSGKGTPPTICLCLVQRYL